MTTTDQPTTDEIRQWLKRRKPYTSSDLVVSNRNDGWNSAMAAAEAFLFPLLAEYERLEAEAERLRNG